MSVNSACFVSEHLKDKLEKYIEQFKGRVRLIRNKEREGLIRSRSIGAENASTCLFVRQRRAALARE